VALGFDDGDPVAEYQLSRFTQGLGELSWTQGHNSRMDVRWAGSGVDRTSMVAKGLVDLRLDVIFAANTPLAAALQLETRTIPIVFVIVGDPVVLGLVESLSHPGGNLTGFITMEASMAGKWLELLTEIAPSTNRAVAMFNPDTAHFQ
jgi:putative tryptophan/tyrosine transport system substrate-binding protein